MSCNWFPTKYDYFHEFLLTQFSLFALNISVCTDTDHQGNRYPAARNSASPPEIFTQQLNTPGTVTILQGVPAATTTTTPATAAPVATTTYTTPTTATTTTYYLQLTITTTTVIIVEFLNDMPLSNSLNILLS